MGRIVKFPGSPDASNLEGADRVLESWEEDTEAGASGSPERVDPSRWGVPRAFFLVRPVGEPPEEQTPAC